MTQRLARLLGLRPEEFGRASALFALSFVLGLSLVSLELASSTGLLVTLEGAQLAWSHVAVAAALPLAGLALAWLRPRVSVASYVTLPLAAFSLVVFAAGWSAGDGTPGALTVLGLWAGAKALSATAIVGFWTLAARTFDVEQSRRVYGLIGAGELIAGVLGGVGAGALQAALPRTDLIALTVAGVLGGVLLTLPLARNLVPEAPAAPADAGASALVRAHQRRCIAYFGASNFTYDILEFLVLVSIQRAYPGQPEAMAGLLGGLFAARLTLSALIRVFVTGHVLGRRGLGPALAGPPATVSGLALAAVALHPMAVSLLVATVALQMAEGIVRNGFGKPAFMAAQRPLPTPTRDQTLLLIETAVEPATTGLAGLALLLLPVQALAGTALLLLPVPGAAVWLFFARNLNRSYRALAPSAAAIPTTPTPTPT